MRSLSNAATGDIIIKTFLVDNSKVKEIKAGERAEGVSFVSTNDILTSTFGNAAAPRILFLPVNFRNKLDGYVSSDAGNYENSLVLCPGNYATPDHIRKLLLSGPPEYKRDEEEGGPLPVGDEARECKLSVRIYFRSCKQRPSFPRSLLHI